MKRRRSSCHPLTSSGLEPFRIGCGCDPYTYGPLGYLANIKGYLVLTRWRAAGQTYFKQSPDLYYIQASQVGHVNIVPAEPAP